MRGYFVNLFRHYLFHRIAFHVAFPSPSLPLPAQNVEKAHFTLRRYTNLFISIIIIIIFFYTPGSIDPRG